MQGPDSELKVLAQVRKKLASDPSIAYQEVLSFPNNTVFQRVDVLVGLNEAVDPTDNLALMSFHKGVVDGLPLRRFKNLYPRFDPGTGQLRIGKAFLEREALPGRRKKLQMDLIFLDDMELYSQAADHRVSGIKKEAEEEPLLREIVIRTFPSADLAVSIAQHERDQIMGFVATSNEFFGMRTKLTRDQVAALKEGAFKFPEQRHLAQPFKTPAEIAARLEIMFGLQAIRDYIKSPFLMI